LAAPALSVTCASLLSAARLFQTPKASVHRQARLTPKAPGLLMVAGRAFAEPSGGSCRSVPGTFE
jgi:hypothetical protein